MIYLLYRYDNIIEVYYGYNIRKFALKEEIEGGGGDTFQPCTLDILQSDFPKSG